MATTVPHLDSCDDLIKLLKHYQPFDGKLTWGPKGFVVRLPKQNRIHFYNYDDSMPPQHTSPFPFTSEGYYDKHSPYWR